MPSSIQLSKEMKARLAAHKQHPRETYEEVIARLLEEAQEDDLEFSEEFEASVQRGLEDLRRGRTLSTEDLLEDLGL